MSILRVLFIIPCVYLVMVPTIVQAGTWKDVWDIAMDIRDMQREADKEREERRKAAQQYEPEILRVYSKWKGGYFRIIGPNPGGEWADDGYPKPAYGWAQIVILVRNSCKDPIYLDVEDFKLHLHSGDIETGKSFIPTTRGLQYQEKRLASGWLKQNEEANGYLIFRIPEVAQKSLRYYGLRYPKVSGCPDIYSPK